MLVTLLCILSEAGFGLTQFTAEKFKGLDDAYPVLVYKLNICTFMLAIG